MVTSQLFQYSVTEVLGVLKVFKTEEVLRRVLTKSGALGVRRVHGHRGFRVCCTGFVGRRFPLRNPRLRLRWEMRDTLQSVYGRREPRAQRNRHLFPNLIESQWVSLETPRDQKVLRRTSRVGGTSKVFRYWFRDYSGRSIFGRIKPNWVIKGIIELELLKKTLFDRKESYMKPLTTGVSRESMEGRDSKSLNHSDCTP